MKGQRKIVEKAIITSFLKHVLLIYFRGFSFTTLLGAKIKGRPRLSEEVKNQRLRIKWQQKIHKEKAKRAKKLNTI